MKAIGKTLLLLVVTVLFVVPSLAQSREELEIVGSVEAMNLDTITVNSLLIDLTSASINTDIQVGTMVAIRAFLDDDSNIIGLEVNPVDENFELGELELIGQLESFDGTSLMIAGQTIDLSNAEVQNGISFDSVVRVHAMPSETNIWTGRLAEPFIPDASDSNPLEDGELEIIGTLEEIARDSFGVSGQRIRINEDTEIEDTLLLGTRVKVRVQIVNGEWLALRAENAVDDGNQDSLDNTNDNNNENSNTNDNTNSNVNGNDNVVNANTAISEDAARDIVLGIYPNTSITSIQLEEKFSGVLVWEVQTSHGLELNIDAQTGIILTIQAIGNTNSNTNSNINGNTNDNSNTNSNTNDNTNSNVNANTNSNSNTNNNGNGNDNNNSNNNDNDSDDDDNSGSSSGNSGSGSDDDD